MLKLKCDGLVSNEKEYSTVHYCDHFVKFIDPNKHASTTFRQYIKIPNIHKTTSDGFFYDAKTTTKSQNIVLRVDNFKTASIKWKKNKRSIKTPNAKIIFKESYESDFELGTDFNTNLPRTEKFYYEWILSVGFDNCCLPITVRYGKNFNLDKFYISLEYEIGDLTPEPLEQQIIDRFIVALDYYKHMINTRKYITPYEPSMSKEIFNIIKKNTTEKVVNDGIQFNTFINNIVTNK